MALQPRTNRRLKTRWTVLAAESISRCLISAGGLFTIVAVLTVCVFLVVTVVPLFKSAKVGPEEQTAMPLPSAPLLYFKVDEYQTTACALFGNGEVRLYSLDDGSVLDTAHPFEDAEVTAASSLGRDDGVAVGFADGSVRIGKLGFSSTFVREEDLKDSLADLKSGKAVKFQKGLVMLVPDKDLYRLAGLQAEFDGDPIPAVADSPVKHVDYVSGPAGAVFCTLTKDGNLSVKLRKFVKKNALDEDIYKILGGKPLKLRECDSKGLPSYMTWKLSRRSTSWMIHKPSSRHCSS